jgi:hypothetical protein
MQLFPSSSASGWADKTSAPLCAATRDRLDRGAERAGGISNEVELREVIDLTAVALQAVTNLSQVLLH